MHITPFGAGRTFPPAELDAAIKPRGHHVFPPTTLMQIENTHNRAGGVIFPQAQVEAVCALAKQRGLATYLDGARLWNVAAATGTPLADSGVPR